MSATSELSAAERARRGPRLTDRGLAILFLVGVAVTSVWTASRGIAVDAYRGLPCPFDAALGTPCPGCGMSRACLGVVRGEWSLAWQLQPFAWPLLALALAWAISPMRSRAAWQRIPARARAVVLQGVLGLILLRWVTL